MKQQQLESECDQFVFGEDDQQNDSRRRKPKGRRWQVKKPPPNCPRVKFTEVSQRASMWGEIGIPDDKRIVISLDCQKMSWAPLERVKTSFDLEAIPGTFLSSRVVSYKWSVYATTVGYPARVSVEICEKNLSDDGGSTFRVGIPYMIVSPRSSVSHILEGSREDVDPSERLNLVVTSLSREITVFLHVVLDARLEVRYY